MSETATEAAAPAKKAPSHADATAQAIDHLNAAGKLLGEVYEHPHHAARVENVQTQLANLVSVLEAMPGQEESRADYAKRLLASHNRRTLAQDFGAVLPDHADRLLDQEIAREGAR